MYAGAKSVPANFACNGARCPLVTQNLPFKVNLAANLPRAENLRYLSP